MSQPLVSTRALDEGRVLLLSLNRPEKRNALSVELCRQLVGALGDVDTQRARAIVLVGEGTIFSAGADLRERDFESELYPMLESTFEAMRDFPLPIVAHVHAPAIGAGVMLAMACDIRVVGPGASFRIPVAEVGIGVDEVTVAALSDLVGGSRARSMLMLGTQMGAAEAVACGFALKEGSMDDAVGVATELARRAPLTLRNLKAEFAGADTEVRERLRRAAWSKRR